MRKILLATTALAAFAGFSSAANAQITVTLGGYTEFFGAIYDNNLIGGTDREFQLEAEIVVKADGKADNGLLYGTKIELQTTGTGATGASNNAETTDEASVYIAGFWGRLELGDFDGASDTLAIYAPLVGVEGIDGDYADFITNTGVINGVSVEMGRQPWGAIIKNPDSSDATKVMYLTPRFAGFQAGFSYTPENGDEGQSVVGTKNSVGYSDFLEYGINYTGNFDGLTVAASATGTSGNGRGTVGAVAGLKDFSAWQVGGQVGYAGFKLGGGYVDADNFNVPTRTDSGDQHAWHAGASYTTGPIAVGLTYADAEGYKRAPGTYADQYQVYGVSGAYTLAPGLLLQSDLMFVDEELKANAATTVKRDTDEYVWLISTRVNF
jgi:outer membrane protein OmpU